MNQLKVYNTLKRCKEDFKPLNDREITFYACGPTVYDYFHIGNARVFIVFDVIRRYLEFKGYKVTFVQNFTDIDDKMIKKAAQEGVTVNELAEKYIDAYFTDAAALRIRQAIIHPRATEHIPAIIELINKLFEKDFAYMAGDDVVFDTGKIENYGVLSGQNSEDLISGARVEVDESKRSPLDFVLWKAAKPDEPSWESPWGVGRPGWHIECSAMAASYLGETIDIHAGGPDLMFPHHENEIAQSEGANGKPFVNYWLHAGYLNIDSKKMSKSLGNVFNVRDLLEKHDPRDIRFFMLSSHYRKPLNFNVDLLGSAAVGRRRLQEIIDNLIASRKRAQSGNTNNDDKALAEKLAKAEEGFLRCMDDDFNTAEALGILFTLGREVNIYLDKETLNRAAIDDVLAFFRKTNSVLDVINSDNESADIEEKVSEAIARREEARCNKDWATADQIRDELKEMGIILEDTPHGVRWKVKK